MSSRVGGAVALAAAALLAVSMLTSWWSGHPTVGGHEQEAKTVFTTLLGATGCNTGGDGSCQNLTELLPSGFKTTAFVEFMLVGISALIAIGLGVTALLASGIRKPLAKLVLVAIGIATAGAIALRVQGPEFKGADVSVYFDLGVMLFAAAAVGCGVASWLAVRVPRPPVVRPKLQPAAPAPKPDFDVAQLFIEDQLRPAALGPEPMIGRPSSPGGALPGPAGPLVPGGQPLFSSAPQLRPLYEADGFVPQPAPAMPARPPTPIPRANIGAILGIPTPPVPRVIDPIVGGASPATIDAERARPPTPPPPTPPPPIPVIATPAIPPPEIVRAKPATLPPPTRSRTHSAPPPPPRATAIGVAGGPAPEPNFDEPLKPPMPPVAVPAVPSIPAPKGSSVGKVAPRKQPTISAAVVPPPPAIVPPVIPSLFPARPETDADPNAGEAAAVGDATDASIHNFPGDDGTSPSVPSTAEERAVEHDEMLAPRDNPGDVPGDAMDDAETRAREKMSARELGLSTSDSTMPLQREESVVSSAPLPSHVPAEESPPTETAESAPAEPAAEEPPPEPAPPVIPDPPKIVPTLTSIAKALRSHARAERERERTATNLKAAPERAGDEPTSPPIAPPVAAQRTSAQIATPRTSAQMRAARASAQLPAQRASVQVPAHIPAQRASAEVPAQRASAQVAAQADADRPRTSTQVPITTAPDNLPPPSEKQAATSGPSPACPQCEAPMAWVEEHLRFYCKSCRMYF